MASLFYRSLLLTALVSLALAGPYPHYRSKQKRTCASPDPDDGLRARHSFLQDNEELDNDLWSGAMIQDRIATFLDSRSMKISDLSNPYTIDKRQSPTEPIYTIDTYFHIVADTYNSVPGREGYVTDKMISDQHAYLTNAYRSAGVAFNLLGVTRTVNDTWASNGDDRAMKTALRQGTYSTLNVYYQTLLQTKSTSAGEPGSVLLGYCSLPSSGITPTTPKSAYVLDGCNVLSGTLPGSYEDGYNLGGTSAHEIGHWNGLLHTFQDTTCDTTNFGDYVADTPQQSVLTNGCPVDKDSCPTSGVRAGTYSGQASTTNPYGPQGYSGPDPVHNFMDYSQDSCYQGFTSGQGARMVNLWVVYRMGL